MLCQSAGYCQTLRTHSREESTRHRSARAHDCGVGISRTVHSTPSRSTTRCGYSSAAAPPFAGKTCPFGSTLQDTRSPTAVLVKARGASARRSRRSGSQVASRLEDQSDPAEQVVDALLRRVHGAAFEDRAHEVVYLELEIRRKLAVLRETDHRADHEREVRLGVLIVLVFVVFVIIGAHDLFVRGAA